MKQRVHLAKALIHDPPILILDEPTIGLDPAAAVELRKAIADLAPAHTVLLTTHDMFEADALCEEIAIVDRGVIVAQGTPTELKARVAASRRVVIEAGSLNGSGPAVEVVLREIPGVSSISHEVRSGGSRLTILCGNTTVALDHALAALRAEHIEISSVQVIEPTLEDAFLAIAGRSYE
jgi:ABC-2 type transport system ATP-binding protein